MDSGRRSGSRDFHRLASLRLEQLARQSTRYADADYRRKIGLGVLHCRLIGLVGSKRPLNFRDLCVAADIEKSYASRLVARLIALGIVRKTSDRLDQRSFTLSLTAPGRRTYNRIYRIALHRNDTWMSALTSEQRRAFFDCLDILERESSKHIAKARRDVSEPTAQPRRTSNRPASKQTRKDTSTRRSASA